MVTRTISGVLRELWREDMPYAGDATVPTGVRIAPGLLSRIRGLLVITAYTGTPVLAATAAVDADGFLVVTVTNSAPGSTITWLLDVALTHSTSQAQDPNAAVIQIVNGTFGGAAVEPPDIADWTDVRYIFLDGDAGDDAHIGYIDAPENTVFTPVQTVPVAIKTTSRLEEIVPKFGNGHKIVVLLKPRAGFAPYDHVAPGDGLGRINRSRCTGYSYMLARGSDHTNSAADKVQLGFQPALLGPNPNGSWTVSYSNSAALGVSKPADLTAAFPQFLALASPTMAVNTLRLTGANFPDPRALLKYRLRSTDNVGAPTYTNLRWTGIRTHGLDEISTWFVPTGMGVGKEIWLELPGVVIRSFAEASGASTVDRSPLVLAGVQISGGMAILGAPAVDEGVYGATYSHIYIDGATSTSVYSNISDDGGLRFTPYYESEGVGVSVNGYGIVADEDAEISISGSRISLDFSVSCGAGSISAAARYITSSYSTFETGYFYNGIEGCDLLQIQYGTLELTLDGLTTITNAYGVPEWTCSITAASAISSAVFTFTNMWNLYAGGNLEAEPATPGIILTHGTYTAIMDIIKSSSLLRAGSGVQVEFLYAAFGTPPNITQSLVDKYVSIALTGFQIQNGVRVLSKWLNVVQPWCPVGIPAFRPALAAGAPDNNPLAVGTIFCQGSLASDLNGAAYNVTPAIALATLSGPENLPLCYPLGVSLTDSVQAIDPVAPRAAGWVLLGFSGTMQVRTDPTHQWSYPAVGPAAYPVCGQTVYLSAATAGTIVGTAAALDVLVGIVSFVANDFTNPYFGVERWIPVHWAPQIADQHALPTHTP